MPSTAAKERYEEQKRKKEQFNQAVATVMDFAKYQNEFENLRAVLGQLEAIVKRENKRDIMLQHLTPSMLSLLEDEIITMLANELEYTVDCDPSSEGEPPLTMDEMYSAAWKVHQALRR